MLWFHCDEVTGEIVTAGTAADAAQAALQQPDAGLVLFVVPDGTVGSPFSATPDFTKLKEHYRRQIDLQVGALREQYITDVPGQAQTYEKKEAEARAWTAGDEVTNPDKYPFMIAEATVRGMTVAAVQAEIMVQVNQLTPVAALIEAHRVAAKQGVLAAATLPAIVAAGTVDWAAVLS